MAAEISTSAPFVIGDLASDGHCNGSHAEAVCVDVSEIELQPSIVLGPGVQADIEASSVSEANHLQERCVDMAMELFVLKTRFDEQAKELQWAKREGDAKERDFKEVQKVCDEERRSSRSFMRRVKALEEENTKMGEENDGLRLDKQRLLGVLRRHREGELSEAFAAHRDRLRKRHMSENEVNRCDVAAAKLGLKAMRQENNRLLARARRQESRIRNLEGDTEVLANKVALVETEADGVREDKTALQQEIDEVRASERRARSDMEHEALLKQEALERVSCAEKAVEEASEARASAELEADAVRAQLSVAVEQLEAKDSARSRHLGSVARYQKMIDAQAFALQAAREQLLGEKIRRQESERQARLRHIASIDSKARAATERASSVGRTEKIRPQKKLGRKPARSGNM